MYSVLLFERFFNRGKIFYLVTKLTGENRLYRLGNYNVRMLNKELVNYSRFFIIIRSGKPSHYMVYINPLKNCFQKIVKGNLSEWIVLPYNRVGSLMEKILSFAVNDPNSLPDMDAVISFLHDKGGAVKHLLHERKLLPL